MPTPPPMDVDSKEILDLATKGTGVLAAVGAALWFVAKPLWFRFFDWSSRRVFRTRNEEGKSVALVDLMPAIVAGQRKMREDIEQMRADMLVQSGLLDALPDLRAIVERTSESSERIERSLEKLGEHVLTLTEKVGKLQGAQER